MSSLACQCPSPPTTRRRARPTPSQMRWLGSALAVGLAALGSPSGPYCIEPYLRQVRMDGATVAFLLHAPAKARLCVAAGGTEVVRTESPAPATFHALEFAGLDAGRTYSYTVEVEGNRGWTAGRPTPFRTAPHADAPFRFAVVGDTQDQPSVWSDVAANVAAACPAFLLHCGDFVGQGRDPDAWPSEFFGPACDLLASTPIVGVLGNHEEDAADWYRFFAPRDGSGRFTFTYGCVDVVCIDSNKDVSRGSVAYRWLDAELARSRALWRIVVHHHPPYSSDDNDYGEARLACARGGDPCVADLPELYDRHDVDLVLCGHVHGYERSLPLRGGRVDRTRGTTYIVTGGAGGRLDGFSPAPNPTAARMRAVHHHLEVAVDPTRLEVRAYDRAGALFDEIVLLPRRAAANVGMVETIAVED